MAEILVFFWHLSLLDFPAKSSEFGSFYEPSQRGLISRTRVFGEKLMVLLEGIKQNFLHDPAHI